MGEDILSVIFLVLICIVVAGIVHKMVPSEMMVPTFALIAVCLWVALDYMLMQRHQAKQACAVAESKQDNIDAQIKQLTEELNAADDSDLSEDQEDEAIDIEASLKPEAKHKNEFDIDLYDRELSTKELFKDSGCAGDTRIANRMKYMGLQARMSQDIRAKWNAEKFRPYFEEELRDGENRDWWDTEADYLDLLM